MGITHADSGLPRVLNGSSTPEEQRFDLLGSTRAISLRNTGGESLWVSFDRREWFDVPSGTSWGSHAVARYFWHCTQIGETSFVVNRVDVGLGEDHPETTSDGDA